MLSDEIRVDADAAPDNGVPASQYSLQIVRQCVWRNRRGRGESRQPSRKTDISILGNSAAGNYRNLREIGLSVENSVVGACPQSAPRTDLATESL